MNIRVKLVFTNMVTFYFWQNYILPFAKQPTGFNLKLHLSFVEYRVGYLKLKWILNNEDCFFKLQIIHTFASFWKNPEINHGTAFILGINDKHSQHRLLYRIWINRRFIATDCPQKLRITGNWLHSMSFHDSIYIG